MPPIPSWLLLASALLLLAVIAYQLYYSRLKATLNAFEEVTEKHLESIHDTIQDKLRPTIRTHDSRPAVAYWASRLLLEVSQAPPAERFVTFYGAASLSTASATKVGSDAPTVEAEAPSPEDGYTRALEELTRTEVRIHRYVHLFHLEDLKERSGAVHHQYIAWLEKQYHQLRTDPNYELIDVVRAPQWGTNMARIITNQAVMEITGNGDAAVEIRDAATAEKIREYARRATLGTPTARNKPKRFGTGVDPRTVDAFSEYKNALEVSLASIEESGQSEE